MALDAHFDLRSTRWAPAKALVVVHALLVDWGWVEPESLGSAGRQVSEIVGQLAAEPGDRIQVSLEFLDHCLSGSVRVCTSDEDATLVREEKFEIEVPAGGRTIADPASASGPLPARRTRRARPATNDQAVPAIDLDRAGATNGARATVTATRRSSRVTAAGEPATVTMSDLADRLQQSVWYVQRRLTAGGLPEPDGHDPAGAPLWRHTTIDAWVGSGSAR